MVSLVKVLDKKDRKEKTVKWNKFIERAVNIILNERKFFDDDLELYWFLVKRQRDIEFPVNYDFVKEVKRRLEEKIKLLKKNTH